MDLTELRGYRILHPLGQGGFGRTFLVEDMQSASRQQYVIKQFHPQTSDPTSYAIAQERFQKEATVLLELCRKQIQIPRLYGYFFHDDNFYLVQEYIEGMTLSEKVRRDGLLTEAFLCQTLIAVLQILEVVHGENIIHRDIKPDNIIIRNRDQQPFLIDFGAVKACFGCLPGQNSGTSIVIGSPGFLAPEQAAGHPIFASDLYSLGMTAIYMLTGKLPQQLQNDRSTHTPVWQADAPDISPRLAAVIDKSVQFSPRDRYTTAPEMLRDLQEAIGMTPATLAVNPAHSADSNQVSHYQPLPAQPVSVTTPTQAVTPRLYAAHINTSRPSGLTTGLLWGVMGGVAIAVAGIGGYLLSSQQQQAVPESTPSSPSPESSLPTVEPTASPTPSEPTPEPVTPSPEPSPFESPAPTPTPQETSPPTTNSTQVNEGEAISLLEQLYFNLSNQNYAAAKSAFSPPLAATFDPGFFDQFGRVSVENLSVTARTDTSISFIGENTYVYRDGSTQREERSYTVRNVDGKLLVTASEFIRVIQSR